MSIINQRVERALLKAFLHEASTSLQGVNCFAPISYKEGVAVKNVLDQAVIGSEAFTINFYCGESEEQLTVPCLSIVAENSTEDADAPGNALVDVRLDLMFPADSDSTGSVIAQIEAASVWLHQMVRRDDLDELVNNQHDNVTVCGVDPSGYQSVRAVDGRLRVHRYSVRLYCAGIMTVEE